MRSARPQRIAPDSPAQLADPAEVPRDRGGLFACERFRPGEGSARDEVTTLRAATDPDAGPTRREGNRARHEGRPARILLRLAPVIAAAWIWPGAALTHGTYEDRLHSAAERILTEPSSPAGYLERSNLHRRAGRLAEAWADLAQAAARAPGLPGVGLMRGLLLQDEGEVRKAIAVLDSLVGRHPHLADARVRLAAALEADGRVRDAAAELERALPDLASPAPDHYLSLARMRAALRPPPNDQALRALAAGIERLGPAPALVEAAIELELARGRSGEALRWHERLRPYMGSDPAWLARRGRLLQSAGQRWEALAAYTAALEAIEALPPARRVAPATKGLEAEIRSRLGDPATGRREGTP